MKTILFFVAIYNLFLFKEYACITGINRVVKDATAPYQVALFSEDKLICSGSLISEDLVLTMSAQCAMAPNIKVVLGTRNIGNLDRHAKKIQIKHAKVYAIMEQIAVLQLDEPVEFTNKIQPIALADKGKRYRSLIGETVVLSGWGEPEYLTSPSIELKKVELKVDNITTCMGIYKSLKVENMHIVPVDMCTSGSSVTRAGACYADLGAPLVLEAKEPILVGMVSYPPPLCNGKLPTIYTRIYRYSSWLDGVLRGIPKEDNIRHPEDDDTYERNLWKGFKF